LTIDFLEFGVHEIPTFYVYLNLIAAYKLHIQTSLVDSLYGQTTFIEEP